MTGIDIRAAVEAAEAPLRWRIEQLLRENERLRSELEKSAEILALVGKG